MKFVLKNIAKIIKNYFKLIITFFVCCQSDPMKNNLLSKESHLVEEKVLEKNNIINKNKKNINLGLKKNKKYAKYFKKNLKNNNILDETTIIIHDPLVCVYDIVLDKDILYKNCAFYYSTYGCYVFNNINNFKKKEINKINFISFIKEILFLLKEYSTIDCLKLFINTKKGNFGSFYIRNENVNICEILDLFYKEKNFRNKKFLIFQKFENYINTPSINKTNSYIQKLNSNTCLYVSTIFDSIEWFIKNNNENVSKYQRFLEFQKNRYTNSETSNNILHHKSPIYITDYIWNTNFTHDIFCFKNKDRLIKDLNNKLSNITMRYDKQKSDLEDLKKNFNKQKTQNNLLKIEYNILNEQNMQLDKQKEGLEIQNKLLFKEINLLKLIIREKEEKEEQKTKNKLINKIKIFRSNTTKNKNKIQKQKFINITKK